MTPEELEPGDVLLLDPSDLTHGISKVIVDRTGSPFSHAMVAVGPGLVVDAATLGEQDITYTDGPGLVDLLTRYDLAAVYRGTNRPDHTRLRDVCAHYVAASKAGPDRPVFSVGDLAGLAALQILATPSVDLPIDTELRVRLRNAFAAALDSGGGRRLFCSEFVYRVLAESGVPPQLPAKPFIPKDTFPLGIEQTGGRWAWQFLKRVRDWLGDLDVDSYLTIVHVGRSVIRHFRDRTPPPATPDWANFYTPADFAAAGSGFTHVGDIVAVAAPPP
jgi:hypothetical protein